MPEDFLEIDERALTLMTGPDLKRLAHAIGLPIDESLSAEAIRIRIHRAAW